MGQNRRFRSGQKAPNDGIYVEIGETGSMVKDPQMVKLTAGEKFPDNTNHNRQWTYKENRNRSRNHYCGFLSLHIVISFTVFLTV